MSNSVDVQKHRASLEQVERQDLVVWPEVIWPEDLVKPILFTPVSRGTMDSLVTDVGVVLSLGKILDHDAFMPSSTT